MDYSKTVDVQLLDHMVIINMVHSIGRNVPMDIIRNGERRAWCPEDMDDEFGWSGTYLEMFPQEEDPVRITSMHCLIPQSLHVSDHEVFYGSPELQYLEHLIAVMDKGEVIKVNGFGKDKATAEAGNGYWLAIEQ